MNENERLQAFTESMTLEENCKFEKPCVTPSENAEETCETVKSSTVTESDQNLEDDLLNYVAKSKAIFKSQQKDDPDLTFQEKREIAENLLKKSHCLFLSKYGQYMKQEHLAYFDKSKEEDYEVSYHINRLQRFFNNSAHHIDIKNRRFNALKTLIEKGEYFSEQEMRKRNPLLYEHLVGQYLTDEQKKARDNAETKSNTFVNLLMENIEKDCLRESQRKQEEEEDDVLEENDSDDESDTESLQQANCSEENPQAGSSSVENSDENADSVADKAKQTVKPCQTISTQEKQVLRQEFVTNMYQSFLEGKDPDFDYSTVDDNEAYDNIDLRTQDEEERYFDSESPETVCPHDNADKSESEDELDAYMRSLKEPTHNELSPHSQN